MPGFRPIVLKFFLPLFLLVGIGMGCMKDYSYEGGPLPPPVIVPEPPQPVIPAYAYCADCKGRDKFEYGRWSFWVDTNFFCGNVTDGVASPERTGFTFFGPSTCSLDTGLIMTIFLPNIALKSDLYNVVSQRATLEYYDNATPSDMFISRNTTEMTFILDQYIHSTLITRGRFFGKVYDKQGAVINVTNGKFEFKFRD